MNFLTKRFLVLALALGAALLQPGIAAADFILIDLTTGNSAVTVTGAPTPYGQVKVDRTDSTHATITFTAANPTGWTYGFGDGGTVGVNVNASSFNVSGIGWTTLFSGGAPAIANDGAGNEDGFGNFNLTFKSHDGWSDSSTDVHFTITRTSGTWADASSVLIANENGARVAAHLFLADRDTGGNDQPGNALATGYVSEGGAINTPVPASLLLAASGLLGLGLVRIRRMVRREPSAA